MSVAVSSASDETGAGTVEADWSPQQAYSVVDEMSTAVLLFGDHRVRALPVAAEQSAVVWLDEWHYRQVGDNTAVLTIDDRPVPYMITGRDQAIGEASVAGLLSGHGVGWRGRAWAPLFFLVSQGQGRWAAYSQASVTGGQLVFMRLPGKAVAGNPRDAYTIKTWLATLAQRHRGHSEQLGNHGQWCINARPGWELEQKFTLPSPPDLWDLATGIREAIGTGTLPGWILEPGNEFEQWNFRNVLFAIAEPASEAGYIALLPTIDGRWIVRRKWFTSDAAVRREDLSEPLHLPESGDLLEFIKDNYHLTPKPLGCYRRIRFNVMAESLATGHVFSVMVDHCIADVDVEDLFQIEVEYVRSRTLRRTDAPNYAVEAEFTAITSWTRQYLSGMNIEAIEHDLSKMTWLTRATTTSPTTVVAP